MSAPVLLAIECSQRVGSVALQDREGNVHEQHFETGARRDDVLQPAVESLVARAGLAPVDLEGCGCSIGPGGFTGLRITIATARALAMTLRVPLYGIPSAAVAAESTPSVESPVLVALACKNSSLWLARLERSSRGDWTGPESLVDGESMPTWFKNAPLLLADEHLPGLVREAARNSGTSILEPRFDASACLKLTSIRHDAAEADDPMGLSPLYPRDPEAVTLFNARQGD